MPVLTGSGVKRLNNKTKTVKAIPYYLHNSTENAWLHVAIINL